MVLRALLIEDHPPGDVVLPCVRACDYKLEFHFTEPISKDNIQNMYVVSLRPSTIEIEKSRKINLSYRSS